MKDIHKQIQELREKDIKTSKKIDEKETIKELNKHKTKTELYKESK